MDRQTENKPNPESGNAIFLIILGVALFAALGYAFNSSNRSSTALMTDEQAKVYANQIIAYGNEVKQAVRRLQLRGCDETEISFENDVVSGYTNPNSPSSKKCHVFDVAGGGLNYKKLDQNWLDADASSFNHYEETIFVPICPLGVGTDLNPTTGSECNTPANTLAHGDLAYITPFIKREICEAINENIFGNSNIPTDVLNSFYANTEYVGDFEVIVAQSINLGSGYNGSKSVCHTVSGGTSLGVGNYAYYNVLIPR